MITVVLLTYRADAALFDACLRSVARSGDADRVVVVDNGQTLDRARVDAIIQEVSGAPPVDLLRTDENRGYAGGMNVGMAAAMEGGASLIALLNDDTVVEAGWLRAIRHHFERPSVGAVQPKILLSDGSADDGPSRIHSVGMSVRRTGAGVDLGYGEADHGQYDSAQTIDLFTGAAVVVSAEMIGAIGGFDERYFMYYEDIDLARRAGAAGWIHLVEPAAVVHHAISSTARSLPYHYRYWQERNRLWWIFRHGPPVMVVLGLALSAARLARHPIPAQARAIWDGLGGFARCRRERRRKHLRVQPLPLGDPRPWTAM